MNEGAPLYTVKTAFTLSQYRDYNRTVQRMSGVYNRLFMTAAGYIAIGVLFAMVFGSWLSVPLFAGLGAVYTWSNLKGLRRAELDQYQREQMTGTVVYRFYDDRVSVETQYGRSDNPCSSIAQVIETDLSFILMVSPNSGIMLPKEDCTPDLEYYIRTRFDIRIVRSPRWRRASMTDMRIGNSY